MSSTMDTMFAKVFSQIFDSTIAENYKVRHIFMDLLVMADSDGVVDKTPEAISRIANIPLDEVKESLSALAEPDEKSRTKENDGRRIELIDSTRDWGWRIVNFLKYREIRDEEARRIANRSYKREQRKRQQMSASCPDSQQSQPMSAHTEAEAEAESTISATPTVLELQSPSEYELERKKEKEVIEAAFEHYCISTEKNRLIYRLTPARSKIATVRLKECLKLTAGDYQKATDLIKDAIDNLAASNFHMGRDPKTNGKKYCDWIKNLFKSYEQMEAWWQ